MYRAFAQGPYTSHCDFSISSIIQSVTKFVVADDMLSTVNDVTDMHMCTLIYVAFSFSIFVQKHFELKPLDEDKNNQAKLPKS